MYEQIISTMLICPDYFSLELVDLVSRLLSRYEENRLGAAERSVRDYCWFRETDWSKVMMRKMMSPPNLPVDRSQDWIKEDDVVQVQDENACDFEEEIF